jgi:hypothetical protein
MTTKRQQTQAKMTRERQVKERRARKLEKKRVAAAERKERLSSTPTRALDDVLT